MAIRINRVYTRTGDKGDTALVGGRRVPKDAPRIEAYGTIDELNSIIGLARVFNAERLKKGKAPRWLDGVFRQIQNELIDRETVLRVALQDDPMKRVREARKQLRHSGIVIFGPYQSHGDAAVGLGEHQQAGFCAHGADQGPTLLRVLQLRQRQDPQFPTGQSPPTLTDTPETAARDSEPPRHPQPWGEPSTGNVGESLAHPKDPRVRCYT